MIPADPVDVVGAVFEMGDVPGDVPGGDCCGGGDVEAVEDEGGLFLFLRLRLEVWRLLGLSFLGCLG